MAALLRLERPVESVRVTLLASRILLDAGFSHGFSTRHGGVSEGPFGTLDLGSPGDQSDPRAVGAFEENMRRFLSAAGLGDRSVVLARQVHGAAVADGDRASLTERREADAIACGDPRRCVAVRTADCVPILLACSRNGQVAAVHAGWKGLALDVVGQAVAALGSRGCAQASLVAAIGPSIGVEAYEVGPEVAAAFAEQGLSSCVVSGWGRPHVDCHAAARHLLERAGVPAAAIDGDPCCTFAHGQDFYSYRRDGQRSGRMAAVIGASPR